jgi:hypothetical protein
VSANSAPASPLAWNSNTFDQVNITGLTVNLTINADSGSPSDGQQIMFRIKDNGTARTLTFTSGSTNSFQTMMAAAPTTTTINKVTYVGCRYNAADSRWDIMAVGTQP